MFIRFSIFFLVIFDVLKAYIFTATPITQLLVLFPITLLGIFEAISKKSLINFFNSPLLIWVFWILYALINTFFINTFNPHRETNELVFIFSIVMCPIFVYLLCSEKLSTKTIINTLIFALSTRSIIALLFDQTGILGNDDFSRFGELFNANTLALGALINCILINMKRVFYNLKPIDFFFLILSVYILIITASVKSGLVFILYLVVALSSHFLEKRRTGIGLQLIMTFLVLGLFFNYFIVDSSLYLRAVEKFTLTEVDNNQLFDRRAAHYILGINIFWQNPIFGIGLRSFVSVTGNTSPLHSEYLSNLIELGLIGIILFLLFYYKIIKTLLITAESLNDQQSLFLHSLNLAVMALLFLGIWQYNNHLWWILTALVIRYVMANASRLKKI